MDNCPCNTPFLQVYTILSEVDMVFSWVFKNRLNKLNKQVGVIYNYPPGNEKDIPGYPIPDRIATAGTHPNTTAALRRPGIESSGANGSRGRPNGGIHSLLPGRWPITMDAMAVGKGRIQSPAGWERQGSH
jgi:hypothetical protein